MDLKQTGCKGGDWIHLAQDRGNTWAVVSIEINFQLLCYVGNLLTISELLAPHKELCCMELVGWLGIKHSRSSCFHISKLTLRVK